MSALFFDKLLKERFYITLDFSNRLATDETLTDHEIVVTLDNVEVDGLVGVSVIDGTEVDIKVQGGIVGNSYKITISATTSLTNILETYITMHVI